MTADILIVCPSPDGYAMKEGKPIGHGAETVLQDALHQAGLIVQEVCTTSFIYDKVDITPFWRSDGAKGKSQVKGNLEPYKKTLWETIQTVKPKLIVPLGDLPTYILTGDSRITTIRGYPYKLADTGIWVLPSLDPHKMVWQNYIWRHYLSHDLKKANEIVSGRKTAHPDFTVVIPEVLSDALAWFDILDTKPKLAVDIEVSNYHTSCIGFAYETDHGISFPIDMRWTEDEELIIWNRIARILESTTIEKVLQNGAFDVQFLIAELGIFIKNFTIDTMISHHIMYPDFLKGLGFLASIYTYHPYWKDELHGKSIKEDN
jgi:uracil-DNA glycosylase